MSLQLARQMKPVRKGSVVAQKIQTVFIDDLDGSEAEGTVRFGLDGAEYEIDLNADHARALRDALSRYVQAARRAGAVPGGQPVAGAGRGRMGWIAPRSASGPRRRAST
jgi:nucleoid-associated protein Lsr2